MSVVGLRFPFPAFFPLFLPARFPFFCFSRASPSFVVFSPPVSQFCCVPPLAVSQFCCVPSARFPVSLCSPVHYFSLVASSPGSVAFFPPASSAVVNGLTSRDYDSFMICFFFIIMSGDCILVIAHSLPNYRMTWDTSLCDVRNVLLAWQAGLIIIQRVIFKA